MDNIAIYLMMLVIFLKQVEKFNSQPQKIIVHIDMIYVQEAKIP